MGLANQEAFSNVCFVVPGCSWDRGELIKIKRDFQTGKKIVEVSYPPTEKGSPRMTTLKRFHPGSDDYTLSYRLRFGSWYDCARGAKAHGVGPKNPTTGCAARTDEGWSVRLITQSGGRPALYIYDQDRRISSGCGQYFTAPNFSKQNFSDWQERWFDIPLYVKVNSPGSNNGVAKLFVDGKQIHQADGLRLRQSGVNDSKIQSIMYNTAYGGGSWEHAPRRTTYVQYSDFRMSRGEVPRNIVNKSVSANWSGSEIF